MIGLITIPTSEYGLGELAYGFKLVGDKWGGIYDRYMTAWSLTSESGESAERRDEASCLWLEVELALPELRTALSRLSVATTAVRAAIDSGEVGRSGLSAPAAILAAAMNNVVVAEQLLDSITYKFGVVVEQVAEQGVAENLLYAFRLYSLERGKRFADIDAVPTAAFPSAKRCSCR